MVCADQAAFQQIEIDEVTEHGKGSVMRLFGVTEVNSIKKYTKRYSFTEW